MGLFLGFLSCSIDLYFYFCANTTVLMTIGSQYSLMSGRLIPPAPVFFLGIVFAIWGLLFSYKFKNLFWFCEQCHW